MPGRVRFEYIKIQINTLKFPLFAPPPPKKKKIIKKKYIYIYIYKIMFDRKKKFIKNSEKIRK